MKSERPQTPAFDWKVKFYYTTKLQRFKRYDFLFHQELNDCSSIFSSWIYFPNALQPRNIVGHSRRKTPGNLENAFKFKENEK